LVVQVDFSIAIARPVEDVFAVLSDPRNSTKWAASSVEMEVLTPGPIRVGSRRRGVARGIAGRTIETVAEITEFEPNRRIAVRTVRASIPFTTSIDFRRLEGVTGINWTWVLEPQGVLRLAEPCSCQC
jgi:uncharacterized protein YndB with AHSA1/START domain